MRGIKHGIRNVIKKKYISKVELGYIRTNKLEDIVKNSELRNEVKIVYFINEE